MVDVFISYKRQERAKANAIADTIAKRGYVVWWDADLVKGETYAEEIMAVIEKAKAAVVLWSAEAVKSGFVQAEANMARKRGILVPVRLNNCRLPIPFVRYQTLDLRQWAGASEDPALEPLLATVARRIDRPRYSHTTSEND